MYVWYSQGDHKEFEDNTTNAYEHSCDGFSAWIILKKTYTHGHSTNHKQRMLKLP